MAAQSVNRARRSRFSLQRNERNWVRDFFLSAAPAFESAAPAFELFRELLPCDLASAAGAGKEQLGGN
ncbi:hypothetical protein SAMN05216228_1010164 [Rhizobium tibeticum]|uniref:Uncharacterized protein n=1 Tax=Rhizobium tibeticum TaxID=501024 RepID=A0A1H8L8M5_9HYPH|nr:hypothetical protein RTCCBAU85039_2806 [Rhizobium tibeticum]SEO01534.1 hypothetical protein SAMN05216228_1010164 [Rhizobium tibeticum]